MRTFPLSFSSLLATGILAAGTLAACGDDGGSGDVDATAVDAAVVDTAIDTPATQGVTVRFAARVGGTAFACGQSYANQGTTAATYVGADFRFFISNIQLVPTGGGAPVPLALDVNANQSAEGVALLDFEDNTGTCQTGTTSTYTTLTGTIATGSYDGITFDLGIPAELNHLDPALATAPYNAPGMLWAWQSGHKFVKADGVVNGNGFNLHLGSTGCPGANPMAPPDAACVNPNRPTVSLTGFDPTAGLVVADVGMVLSGADLTVNTTGTAPGCMSFPGDPECEAIFPNLGLAYGTVPAGAQTLFHGE